MRIQKFGVGAFVLALGVMAACHKGDGMGPMEGLRSVFATNRTAATQVFSVNGASGGTVVGAHGMFLSIAPFAFRNANGTPVSGSVELELLEAPTYRDMLWLNLATMGERSNGHRGALRSGGEMRVRATAGGVQVNVVPNAVRFHMPVVQVEPAMRQFAGEISGNDALVWKDAGALEVVEEDSSYYYEGSAEPWAGESSNWPPYAYINCDHFPPPGGDSTDVTVTFQNLTSLGNTSGWIVIPSLNCMVYLEVAQGAQLSAGFPLATGLTGTFVVSASRTGSTIPRSHPSRSRRVWICP